MLRSGLRRHSNVNEISSKNVPFVENINTDMGLSNNHASKQQKKKGRKKKIGSKNNENECILSWNVQQEQNVKESVRNKINLEERRVLKCKRRLKETAIVNEDDSIKFHLENLHVQGQQPIVDHKSLHMLPNKSKLNENCGTSPNKKMTLIVNEVTPVSSQKTKKRDTFEFGIVDATREVDRRNTFDVIPESSYLLSAKKKMHNNSNQAMLETFPTSQFAKNSLTPLKINKKRNLSKLNLGKQHRKIKISESKSSLTDSGISSASILLRRAQKMTPHTPHMQNSAKLPLFSEKEGGNLIQKSQSKVKKVPNYKAIHKKAFDQMESIDVHVQRKADRAKALKSGQKVHVGSSKRASTEVTVTARKGLKFGDGDIENSSQRTTGIKSVGFHITNPSKTTLIKHPKTPKPSKQEILNTYRTKIPKPTKTTTGANIPTADAIEKRKEVLQQEINSLKTKSKVSVASIESRRVHVKGVRSNRRFDLLMNMRQARA